MIVEMSHFLLLLISREKSLKIEFLSKIFQNYIIVMLKIIGWENEVRGVFRVEKCPNWLRLVRVVDSSNDKAANLYATIHDNQVKYHVMFIIDSTQVL